MIFNTPLWTTAFAVLAAASPVKRADVPGKVFDRFVTIWLENTDFDAANADPNLNALAAQGIQLNNYFGLSHPSEPNYIASVGGEYFGLNDDRTISVSSDVSTVVDLLEDKGISWAEYMEDHAVRKHNPLINFDSVAQDSGRAGLVKNYVTFQKDLQADQLPQWFHMSPNLQNDGHDTGVAFAGKYIRGFLEPLLKDPKFNKPKTLIALTFDENETKNSANRVRTILLGSAIPASLKGTSDNNFYTHYSLISTLEANWDLHTLGRHDVGANVFKVVADKSGDTLRSPQTIPQLDGPYPGFLNSKKNAPMPIPNTSIVVNKRTVLPKIVDAFGSPDKQKCTVYHGRVDVPDIHNPPTLPNGC